MQDAGQAKWLSGQKHLQCKLEDAFDSQNQHTMPDLVACISNPKTPAMKWEADTGTAQPPGLSMWCSRK